MRDRCNTIFAAPQFADLGAGCDWFVDWFQASDNPNLHFAEVACPDDLVNRSGVDGRPLADVVAPMCEGPATCTCDCAWTDGGRNCGTDDGSCGTDDGSCCWGVCCG